MIVAETPPEILRVFRLDAMLGAVPTSLEGWSQWRDGHEPTPLDGTTPGGEIHYTAGRTGYPKGVVRRTPTPAQRDGWMANTSAIFGATSPSDVALIAGPLHHLGPYRLCKHAIDRRMAVVLLPRFEPEELLARIERHRVTHLHMVPFMFRRLLALPHAIRAKYSVSSLKRVLHGAAPCPIEVKQRMIAWWGPIFYEYYATAEYHVVTLCSTEEWQARPGTVGRPMPGCTVRILDSADRSLPPGQIGTIYARNEAVSDFTYNRDPARRRDCERDGLITVGDLGYLDEDGFLFIKGWESDVIFTEGATVYPSEVEAALMSHPAVHECAVFGIPDPKAGEAVCAVVAPEPDAQLDEFALKAYLFERLDSAHRPVRIEFCDQLPREETGKLFKRRLRDPYWAGVGRRR